MLLARRSRRPRCCAGLPRVHPAGAGRPQRLLRLPPRAARAALPRGAPPAKGVRHRLVLGSAARRRRPRRSRRCWTPCPAAPARGPGDAARRAAEHVRRALPAWRSVVLAGGLRQRDSRRSGRGRTRSSAPSCRRRQSTMHLYPIDGAAHDVDPNDTAFSYRDAQVGDRVSPASTPIRQTRMRSDSGRVDYFEALHPYSAGGAYVNMMMDEGQERVRASYGELRPPRAHQGSVRPAEPLPRQPEHPAAGVARRRWPFGRPRRGGRLMCAF